MLDELKNRIKSGIDELRASLKKAPSKIEVNKESEAESTPEDNVMINNNAEAPLDDLRFKQYVRFGGIILLITGLIAVYVIIDLDFSAKPVSKLKENKEKEANVAKIELATESIKGASKWQGYFEDKLEEEKASTQQQIDTLKKTIEGNHKKELSTHNQDIQQINRRLSAALNELEKVRAENASIQENIEALQTKDEVELPRNIDLQDIVEENDIEPAVSSFNYIPATSIVEGYILGGLSVSTSVNAASEPIPVGIKIKGRSNLPEDFAMDLNDCRILASCYGDISSERAVVRADQLICENKQEGLITNTKISGVIYGDDGLNGIRGNVVSMSGKHLKNAFVSGMLSGVASVGGGKDGFTLSPQGAISTSKKDPKDLLEGGLLGGTTSASEKLADYHIKLAENISPVILVPSGTKVNIMFTKGVFIGSQGIKSKIARERKKK